MKFWKQIAPFESTVREVSFKWSHIGFCPKSDQHEISPNNIIALENRVVMRIEVMIREDVSN